MNYYRRYMADYLSKTAGLTLVEHGAYTLLLDYLYLSDGTLPGDEEEICRMVRAVKAAERQAVTKVLGKFFVKTSSGYINPRAVEEIELAKPAIEAAKANGRAGAEMRWGSPKEKAKNTRSARLSEARRKGTHTDEEWVALVEVCGSKCLKCQTPMSELIGGTVCKDHIVPIYLGGSDGIDNLQPMCRECNTGKGKDTTDLRPANWRERLEKRLANFIEMPSETSGQRLASYPPTTNHQPPENIKEKTFASDDAKGLPKERPKDQIWDTMLAVCGLNGSKPTLSERGAWNKSAQALRAVNATPREIQARAVAYRKRWPNVSLTPTSLARRWSECVADTQKINSPPALCVQCGKAPIAYGPTKTCTECTRAKTESVEATT